MGKSKLYREAPEEAVQRTHRNLGPKKFDVTRFFFQKHRKASKSLRKRKKINKSYRNATRRKSY